MKTKPKETKAARIRRLEQRVLDYADALELERRLFATMSFMESRQHANERLQAAINVLFEGVLELRKARAEK